MKNKVAKETDANQRERCSYLNKFSFEKLTLDKLNPNAIDQTDSRVTTLETMKYQKVNNIEQT